MDDPLKRLIGLAWRTVPASEANEAIARARRATALVEEAVSRGGLEAPPDQAASDGEADAPMARAYEVELAPDATLETFARDQLPKLVYHLESIGAHLPRAAGVVLCVFSGSELHFIQAGELIGGLCAELKLTPAELSTRYGTHELRTAIRAAPPASDSPPARALALPPPEPEGKR